jgi:EAL and modified HD-GYP domain-containing signal transduction protein
MVDVLPPSMTVLEILETLDPTPRLIAACKKLKSAGFRIALDDFVWKPKFEALVELADYIKVDFLQTGADERKAMLEKLSSRPVALLAEKVETEADRKQASAEGFTLFQGYYFCRPQLMTKRKVPANRFSHIQILELLRQEPLDIAQLSQLVKQDTALTYRFLRLVNSPIAAMRQEVRSVRSALLAVGDDAVRRIATLAIATELNGTQPQEILRMTFVRARFCELAAGLCAMGSGEQYLLGMFSLLPAMLRVSMSDLAPSLPLRAKIREALLGTVSVESSLLRWVGGYERGEWLCCDSIAQSYGLNQDELVRCYTEAVVWAEEALHFAV